MFVIKKVLTPFLLPPGIFIISVIFLGAWSLNKKNWKACILALIVGCFAWALSISPVSDAIIMGLESEYGIPKDTEGDVIILLGHGVWEKAPDMTGLGAPSDIYLTRIVTALRLFKKLDTPIIISGIETVNDDGAKNHIVKRFLMDLGLSENKIIIEDKSRDTLENAKFTQEICSKLGFTAPILVTSAYHIKRSIMTFEKVGLNVLPYPTGFKSWRGKKYRWSSYLPGNFQTASLAIKEYLGIVYYKLAYHRNL